MAKTTPATSQPFHFSPDGGNLNYLTNWKQQETDIDLTAADAGVLMWNTAKRRAQYHDGTTLYEFALLRDLATFTRSRGTWDASTGIPTAAGSSLLPGAAIENGDRWLVTAPGTIAGIGGGVDAVENGDWIVAIADGAAAAAQFTVIQSNIDPTLFNTTETQTVSLVADTPLVVTAANLTAIEDWRVVNQDVVEALTSATTLTLQSSSALANVTVRLFGKA